MRSLIKRILFRPLRFLIFRYLSKPRAYRNKGLKLTVFPGVFHPGFFISTGLLIRFLGQLNLNNKTLLELGAGSGAVGFAAESLGARVTLSDINQKAIDGLLHNAQNLNSEAEIIKSDLFAQLPASVFDFIIINPPYYPKAPNDESEMAWFCGTEFEYFKNLFAQLPAHIHPHSQVFMILSEDCAIDHIKQLAAQCGFDMPLRKKTRKWWEWNFIFQISPSPASPHPKT